MVPELVEGFEGYEKKYVCSIIPSMKKYFLLLTLCLFITACASTSSDSQEVEEEPQIPQLFSDWQYRGFGQEYPLWAEAALNEGDSETIEIRFGQNIDMLIPHESEELESNVVKETWVYIDPYYEEYEERYAFIRMMEE